MSIDRRVRLLSGTDEASSEVIRCLDEFTVAVLLPDGRVSWPHQLIAVALVDLLGRLLPQVNIHVDADIESDPRLPPGPERLLDRLEAARARGGLAPRADARPAHLVVAIGPRTDGAHVDIHVDGAGWISYIGTDPSHLAPQGRPLVAVGPLVAAARAAAHVTAAALEPVRRRQPPPHRSYSDSLDYSVSADPPVARDLARADEIYAVQVGAGSIGGSAVYLLARTPELRGALIVVDPQRLEPHNPDRAILATADAATRRVLKVSEAKEALAHHPHLEVEAVDRTIADYVASQPRERTLPLLLCAVDSAESRRSVQDCMPLDVINAACHPHEIAVSRHRTGDGPCVCCLHMSEVLDAATTRKQLIAQATGLSERQVIELVARKAPLSSALLRAIEGARGLPAGALAQHRGATLEELYDQHLLYGEIPVDTDGGEVRVAAPFVTALAGFLMAGEALKSAAGREYEPFVLGPAGIAIRYRESPYSSPDHAQLDSPERWPTSECLCRSTRRQRILHGRYTVGTQGAGSPARPTVARPSDT